LTRPAAAFLDGSFAKTMRLSSCTRRASRSAIRSRFFFSIRSLFFRSRSSVNSTFMLRGSPCSKLPGCCTIAEHTSAT